jgi:UPF0716 protein FxsA
VGKLLFLLFVVVPLAELYLLLVLGSVLGFWPTVAIVLVTGVLGATLAKREGLRVFRKWSDAIAEGRVPEEGVLGGLLVLVGGVLLVTPGVITDVTGLLLLFPPTRRFVAERLRRYAERRVRDGRIRVVSYHVGGMGAPFGGMGVPFGQPMDARPASEPGVIDVEGEVIEVDGVVREPKRLPE